MKKLFTKMLAIVSLMLVGTLGSWAEEAVISFNMGTNGAEATGSNSITGATGSMAEGWTIAITGNSSKNWGGGNGSIVYAGKTYKTLKNSNAAQNTITCPAGKVATGITFLVVTNDDNTDGKLSEIDGASCSDLVSSHKDYTNFTTITKTINNKDKFTFTFSTKQVCFIAIVTYTTAAAETKVKDPEVSATNGVVTLSSRTAGAEIYYTTDGTIPSKTNGTKYTAPFTLTNSCSVLAIGAKSGLEDSDVTAKDVFVSHPDALAVLGFNGGTLNAGQNEWSNDKGYVLTDLAEGRTIGYTNIAGSQDGFKLNHTDSYSLSVPADVKVTKIVVVGKSWLEGCSTFAIDGFTPASQSFFNKETRETPTYVKTIEFTPAAELGYGETITLRPGGTQLGAYIEVYGTIIGEPIQKFSMSVAATSDQTTVGTDPVELTAAQATVTGGTVSVGGKSGQKFIGSSSSKYYFRFSGKDIYFHAALTSAIKNGDVISYTTTDSEELVFTTTATRAEANKTENHTYTVKDGDGLAGSTDLYIWRASGNTTIFNNLTIAEPTAAKVNVSEAAYATFYDSQNAVLLPEGVEGYIFGLDDYDYTMEIPQLIKVYEAGDAVPAGEPVVLKAAAKDYVLAYTTTDAPTVNEAYLDETGSVKNFLAGSDVDATATVGGIAGLNGFPAELCYFYALSLNKEGVLASVGFYWMNETGAPFDTKAHKAYLVLPVMYAGVDMQAKSSFPFNPDNTVTGIRDINTVAKNSAAFNLAGQRVAKNAKGIVIINGTKRINK